MRGIPRGTTVSSSLPLLELYVRSGEVLQDFYAGTFRIEDIHDPAAGVTAIKVVTAAFTAGNKLGTGRYVIPFATTSLWSLGTHRAVCQYTLTNGGPTITQVIEFEILDAVDWITGLDFVSYVSTRQLALDGYVANSVVTTAADCQKLHRHLSRIARQVEGWTHRFFEPRYMAVRTRVKHDGPIAFLQEAIIALDKVEAMWRITDDSTDEDSYEYGVGTYRVYNRHLDTMGQEDDRSDPKVVRILTSAGTGYTFGWPSRWQGLKISGVFGYTDPEFNATGLRTALGRTPADIAQVCSVLLQRTLTDLSLADPMTWNPGRVRSYKTDLQAVSFFGAGGSGSSGSWSDLSGDPTIDQILARYGPPESFAATGENYEE